MAAEPDFLNGWTFEWQRGHDLLQDPTTDRRWRGLAARASTQVFQLPEMVRVWFETKGRALGDEPVLCWARHTAGPEALVVFALRRGSRRNAWERRLVGVGEPHFDYQDPLLTDANAGPGLLQALAGELRRQGQMCEKFGLYRLRMPGAGCEDSACAAPCITLAGHSDAKGFWRARSDSLVTDIARQRRRLAATGAIQLEVLGPDRASEGPAELARMVTAYEVLHQDEASAGLFRTPGTGDFFKALVAVLLPAGLVHFSVLRVGQEPCSWGIGFMHGAVLTYYKPAYVAAYARWSPGKQHLAMLVELGLREGWRAIDLGPGTEPYKSWWADAAVPLGMLQGRTQSWRSRVGGLLAAVRSQS